MQRDPAAYGDFSVGPEPPLSVRENCPGCGRKIEWVPEYEDRGVGTERRWIHSVADCENPHCGLSMTWDPNRPHLKALRRGEAMERYDAEQASEQQSLFEEAA